MAHKLYSNRNLICELLKDLYSYLSNCASFYSELWEKKPLLVKRHMENYNDGWFSTAEMDRILREVIYNDKAFPCVAICRLKPQIGKDVLVLVLLSLQ